MVMKVVLRKAFQKRSMVPIALHGFSPEKTLVRFCRPTNTSPPAIRPVLGSTPVLVWKKASRIDMATGIPATTRMTMRVGANSIQAQSALTIARRVLLYACGHRLRWPANSRFAVAVAMRLPPLRNAPSSQRSTWLRREPADTNYYLIRVCNLACSACKAASELS